jgi:hypothetical protein
MKKTPAVNCIRSSLDAESHGDRASQRVVPSDRTFRLERVHSRSHYKDRLVLLRHEESRKFVIDHEDRAAKCPSFRAFARLRSQYLYL